MKHLSFYFRLAVAVAAVVTLSGCGEKKSSSNVSGDALSVSVEHPQVRSVMIHKSYPGYTYANAKADIVGRVNGTILTRPYSGGDYVAKGTVLFTIDPSQYADAVRQAEAALATANSQYEYASRQYEAMKLALESDAVSAMDVVQARSNMEQARASIKRSEAALADSRTNLSYCTVRAPFAGRMSGATLDPGAYVSGGGAPVTLATIYDDSKIVVVFNVEDSQYQHVLATQADNDTIYNNIPVSFPDEGNSVYSAALTYTAPAIDKSTGTFTLKASIPNTRGLLRDGMYVTVNLPVGVVDNAVLVKDSSIGTDQLGNYVYTVSDSNTVVYTPIKTGELFEDSLRIVTDGISKDSRYVTSAMLKVRDGMRVNPVTSNAGVK